MSTRTLGRRTFLEIAAGTTLAVVVESGSGKSTLLNAVAGGFFFVGGQVLAGILGSAWWTASVARARGGIFKDRLPVFAILGTVLLVVPAGDLGQREHLLLAATLLVYALAQRYTQPDEVRS